MTVATTERAETFDPAFATDPADQAVVMNVFQRLLTTAPGDGTLKPDAASDCLFESPVLYRCYLRDGLVFHDGTSVTATDVKFSLQRAQSLGRLSGALPSLERIEAPTPRRVEFYLKWPDNQFGYALAAPSASIVSVRSYEIDAARPNNLAAVGSGPYRLTNIASNGLLFTAHNRYSGMTPPGLERILLRYVDDSAALEDAVADGSIDVVWRGLSEPATERLSAAAGRNAATAFHPVTEPGASLRVLVWNPTSPLRSDAGLRALVAAALQGDRTLDSLLPPGLDAHTASFPMGGTATVPEPPSSRPRLRLSYDRGDAAQADQAAQMKTRIEAAGVGVDITPGDAQADLRLTDSAAWVNAPSAYLAAYTAAPLPGSAAKVAELDQRYRGVTDRTQQATALAEIQKQAAADLVVLPLEQRNGMMFAAPGVAVNDPRGGPGWQLALWSIRK